MDEKKTVDKIKIKVLQCQVGRFNLLSNEETLSFRMALYEEDKVLERDGIKAILSYSGDADKYEDFKNYAEGDLSWIFDECFHYSKSVFGTTDYEAQTLLFLTEYYKRFEDIAKTEAELKRAKLEKKIEDLKRELQGNLEPYDYRYSIDRIFEKEVGKYQEWLDDEKKKLSQYVVGTDLYNKSLNRIKGYEQKITSLKGNQ